MVFPWVILLQAAYYSVVMFLTIFLMAALLRGFLWPYFRVRTSFGKYILVKIRTPLRDYFKVGWVNEGFLIYKHKKDEVKMLSIPQERCFYKCMNVNWIDVDEALNSICVQSYNHVTGYDAVKYSDLLKRALMKPAVGDNKEKIILMLLIVLVVIGVFCGYMLFMQGKVLSVMHQQIPKILEGMKGLVTGGVV